MKNGTYEKVQAVLESVNAGMPVGRACAKHHISTPTFYANRKQVSRSRAGEVSRAGGMPTWSPTVPTPSPSEACCQTACNAVPAPSNSEVERLRKLCDVLAGIVRAQLGVEVKLSQNCW